MQLMLIIAFAGGSNSSTVTAAIQLSLCHDMQGLGGSQQVATRLTGELMACRETSLVSRHMLPPWLPFALFSGSKGPGTHCCCTTASLMLYNEEGSGCDCGIASSISPHGTHSPVVLSYLH